ncbi:MAG: hemerythrin domain-containing protein, partial [Acidobacteriota bacterium]|nr:hemerythrin domain-containing protein [Acidobacteriota bacterium]
MGTATAVLRNEHKALSKCLNFTESVAAQIRRGEVVQGEVLGQAVECFRVFMDGCLFAKEENFLFHMLEGKGMSRRSGPLGLMLTQHAKVRKLLKQMAQTAAEGEAG